MRESGVLKGPRHNLAIQSKKDDGKKKFEVPVLVTKNVRNQPIEAMLKFEDQKQKARLNRDNMSVDNWSVAASHQSNVSLDVKKYFWSPMYLGGLTLGSQMQSP